MSKKSRRRNKKILGALGALGALALMGRRKGTAAADVDSGRGSGLRPTVDDMPKTVKTPKNTVVSTPKTIMDSMPKRPKLNEKSIRVKDGKVFTIKGAKEGKPPKMAGIDTPGISVREDGSIMAKGVLYPNRTAYMNRGKLPANLTKGMGMDRVEGVNIPDENFKTSEFDYFAKGGRVKKKPFAKRGFGRAYKKGRK